MVQCMMSAPDVVKFSIADGLMVLQVTELLFALVLGCCSITDPGNISVRVQCNVSFFLPNNLTEEHNVRQ